jgi:hypothetical protein
MTQQRLRDRRAVDRSSKPGLAKLGLRGCGVLLGSAALISLLASCSRPVEPSPFVAIEHEISPEPARVGTDTVTLKLSDAAGKPITGALIAVEADMSHAGMSPHFAEAKEEEGSGRYRAQLEFPMAGDWVILLHITLRGGKKLERQIDVRGVRPGVRPN